MKYIAFKDTYNEQVYDTETMKITWTNYPKIFIQCSENFKPVLSRKTCKVTESRKKANPNVVQFYKKYFKKNLLRK